MEWIDYDTINLNTPQLLTDGEGVYIRGTQLKPFLFQISGPTKYLKDIAWTHWMPFPHPQINKEL